jgi:uncharacterized membrane protein YphA (DoxX/SURF4 family)
MDDHHMDNLADSTLISDYVVVSARWIVGLALMVAGATKLRGRLALTQAIARYGLVPNWLLKPVGILLPEIEFLLGAAIFFGVMVGAASWSAAVLLSTFTLAVLWNWIRGRRFECGCFGDLLPDRIGPILVARNTVLVLLATGTATVPSPYLAFDALVTSSTAPRPPLVDAIPLAAMTAGGLGLYLAGMAAVGALRAEQAWRRSRAADPVAGDAAMLNLATADGTLLATRRY